MPHRHRHTETYYVDDDVVLIAEFTDRDGNPANPTTVTCTVVDPDGSAEVVAMAATEVGHWEGHFVPSKPGLHKWEAKGTGAVQKGDHDSFVVIQDLT